MKDNLKSILRQGTTGSTGGGKNNLNEESGDAPLFQSQNTQSESATPAVQIVPLKSEARRMKILERKQNKMKLMRQLVK